MKGSITNEYTVWCASEQCVEWYQEAGAINKTDALKLFKKRGWKLQNTKWYCPDCNESK